MAVSVSKRNPKPSSREGNETMRHFPFGCLCRLLYRLPTAVLLLVLVFLWSSTTTIISGNIVHVCVSTRKLQLNNLYCLSAGTQPNIKPFPVMKNFTLADNTVKEVADSVPESHPVSIFRPNEHSARDEEIENAARSIEEQLELHRSWVAHSKERSCAGRGMFVYDLAPKFNKDLMAQCNDMVSWMDLCKHMVNGGLGQPMPRLGNHWYQTHQYSLEPIFHSRALNHPCRVHNADQAKLFYVPFYGGLDILRWHFKNVSDEVKDRLGLELEDEWILVGHSVP
ncbi:hypothetical protein MLD38_039128 [Melastoma candidum]|uniref:Uncharacterized protein n=1 Tax=Melastoma candidum TaxID=119954 RepID=A0ACB9L1U3_9MYRT|nr:hypothetical protein MLD38_039128 [Melastoma candidum]